MIKFLKSFFFQLTVTVIAGFVVIGIGLMMVSNAFKDKSVSVSDRSVLRINLHGNLEERKESDPFSELIGEEAGLDLSDIKKSIQMASKDDKIKGIFLHVGMVGNGGWASIEDLRNELMEFKKTKKFIYAYGEVYSKKMYYLCTAADKIFLYPTGIVEWNGLASTPMFYKKLLTEKLEMEPMVFRVGTFKSAVEPFVLEKMSDANRLQTQTFLNDFWNHILKGISDTRKVSIEQLQAYADNLSINHGEQALKVGLIDGLKHEDEVLDLLRDQSGLGKEEKVRFVKVTDYAKKYEPKGSANKIAVVYAVGQIVSGKSNNDNLGSETFVKALREAREDKNVKAIVIRVNSPGGSALASDVMAREVELAKKAKPVYISFGDVAASGGYYISAGGHKIYAEPTTITGSIGVFGLLFNTQKMFNNKLGITFDRVTTSKYGDLGNLNRPMSELESQTIQQSVNKIYGDFIAVVQKGRKFADSLAVDSIAQGRVWSGIRAKQIGLVDEIGGINKAIQDIAKKAGLGDDYDIVEYPQKQKFIDKILKKDVEAFVLDNYFTKEEYELYRQTKQIRSLKTGVYMLETNYRVE